MGPASFAAFPRFSTALVYFLNLFAMLIYCPGNSDMDSSFADVLLDKTYNYSTASLRIVNGASTRGVDTMLTRGCALITKIGLNLFPKLSLTDYSQRIWTT